MLTPGKGAELAGPHARAVHRVVAANFALRRAHPRHAAVALRDAERGDAFQDFDAAIAGTLGECHGDIHRIHAAIFLDVKAGFDVIDLCE